MFDNGGINAAIYLGDFSNIRLIMHCNLLIVTIMLICNAYLCMYKFLGGINNRHNIIISTIN